MPTNITLKIIKFESSKNGEFEVSCKIFFNEQEKQLNLNFTQDILKMLIRDIPSFLLGIEKQIEGHLDEGTVGLGDVSEKQKMEGSLKQKVFVGLPQQILDAVNYNFSEETQRILKSSKETTVTILHLRVLRALTDSLVDYDQSHSLIISNRARLPKISAQTIDSFLYNTRTSALQLVQAAFQTEHLIPPKNPTGPAGKTDSLQFEHIQALPTASIKTVIKGKAAKEQLEGKLRTVYLLKDGENASEALLDLLNNCQTEADWQLGECVVNYISLLQTLQLVYGKEIGKKIFDETFNKDLRKVIIGSYSLLEGTEQYCLGSQLGDKSLIAPLNPLSYFVEKFSGDAKSARPQQMFLDTSYGRLSTEISVSKVMRLIKDPQKTIAELDQYLLEQSDNVYKLRTHFWLERSKGNTISFAREQLVLKLKEGVQHFIKHEFKKAIEIFENIKPEFEKLLKKYQTSKDEQSIKIIKNHLISVNYNLGCSYLEDKNPVAAKKYLQAAVTFSTELYGGKAEPKYANKLAACENQLKENKAEQPEEKIIEAPQP